MMYIIKILLKAMRIHRIFHSLQMPLLDNIENDLPCSQGSEEFDVYPPPKRFCSGLSDGEPEMNCNQNHGSQFWESWSCADVVEQLEQEGLGEVADRFRGTLLGRLAPVLKTIYHQCFISSTCSQSNSDGSVLTEPSE